MSKLQSERWIRYALIVLAGILVGLLIFLFFQYQALRRAQLIGEWRLRSVVFLEHHAPLPVSDADTVVRTWMTFDYVNKLFALPPAYLKTQLGVVASSSYPRLTIANYAKAENASTTAVLDQVESAVQNFSSSTAAVPATQTSTTSPSK